MILKIRRNWVLVAISMISLISCDDDNVTSDIDQDDKTRYKTGLWIVNEGAFLSENASITWYNSAYKSPEQNIFKAPGISFAGDVAQSLTIKNDSAFLVLNGSNRIEVIQADSVASLGAITHADIISPRYLEVINGKAYISVWGNYDENYSLVDSYVLTYDLKTGATKKIDTDEGTENLLQVGDKLFVSNNNFGSSSTLAVIDLDTDQLIKHIDVSAGPAEMVLDENDDLWVIATGTFDGKDGGLVKVNTSTLEVEETIELKENPDADLAITPDGTALIYRIGKSIYKMNIASGAAPASPLIDLSNLTAPYSFEVDPKSGDIYVGDALDFSSAGSVYIYSADGALKSNFKTGISPTYFVFR